MATDLNPEQLQLAHCPACGAYTFPATAPGCRVCGAAPHTLRAQPLPGTPLLHNYVTVHAALAPGLPVPCVVGEVQLAPGVVEEALIAVADETALRPGMALAAVRVPASAEGGPAGWQFVPLNSGVAA
jgi:uncharacterized OB-fold protein